MTDSNAWHYRPLDNSRMKRLVNLLRPYANRPNPTLAFFRALTGERLAELLSILTDQPVQWIRANYRLALAVGVLVEFAWNGNDLIGQFYAWRFASAFEKIKEVN